MITLWHGGRDLEYNYREFKSSNKGRWEYGPGLYLTTHYDRAYKYAKGGGKTYQVTFQEGNDINTVDLNLNDVYEFINSYCIKSKRKQICDDVFNNTLRHVNKEKINANSFLNIIINNDAIPSTKTEYLNNFLVDNKIDYSIINRFGGHDETVYVIFNNKLLKNVKVLKSNAVNIEDRILSITKTQLKP